MKVSKIVLLTLAFLLHGITIASPQGAQNAQNAYPIADSSAACFLGGAAGNRWLNAATAVRTMRGGERYRIYSLTGQVGEATATRPESMDVPCPETLQVNMTPELPEGAIAIGGAWNAMPRIPRAVGASDPAYQTVIADILRRNGIPRPQVTITQVLRIDLEGDGTEEVLISATRYATGGLPRVRVGDYSLVVLRKLINGQAQNIVVTGEYHRRAANFAAPNTYIVTGVADANGDGTMEIFVHGRYYEGAWTTVYRLNGNRVAEALQCGCGV